MYIKELLGRHREVYLNDLLDFYNENTGGAREILIELNIKEPIKQFKLYRMDHCAQINNEPKFTDFNSDKYLDFDPIEYKYGDMKIELNPFYWNGCEFILKPIPKDQNWLIEWTTKWIDEEDNNIVDQNGLSEVIHCVARPEQSRDIYSFSVDFGSAETEAFLDLINEVYLQDIKELKIGSFSMISKSK